MSGYWLKNGRLQEAPPAGFEGYEPTAAFLLAADGGMRRLRQEPFYAPELSEGEGLLMYGGEFLAEPLEIQIEFMKAENARKWLEALILRHVERTRHIDGALWVLAEMKEVYI